MKFFTPFLLFAPSASAFLFFNSPEAAPGLTQILDGQKVQRLKIDLDVGKEEDDSHLIVRDVVFDLYHDSPLHDHVAMPGQNGPNPKVSTGIRRLEVIEGGHFISMQGTEHIQALDSCWEVNWKKDSPAGALVCGFELRKDYKRNDATFSKGRIYLSFPIWNEEGLKQAREQKAYVLKRAEEALKEKDDEMAKYMEEKNLIKKALHYRNAYAAAETYWNQPVKRMNMVPEDDEVIVLQDDLLLTTKGLIWSKNLPAGQQVLLGSATISTNENQDEE